MPERLEAACLKALAKQPAQRYASMAELLEALEGSDAAAGRSRRVGAWLVGAALLVGLSLSVWAVSGTGSARGPAEKTPAPPAQSAKSLPGGGVRSPQPERWASGYDPRDYPTPTAEDELLFARTAVALPRPIAILEGLCRRGHERALRRLGEWYLTGKSGQQFPGRGLQLLRRAAMAGNVFAAGDLVAVYARSEQIPKRAFSMVATRTLADSLGIEPDPTLMSALLVLAARGDDSRRALFQQWLADLRAELQGQGARPPAPDEALRIVRATFAPLARAELERQAEAAIERFVREGMSVEERGGLELRLRSTGAEGANSLGKKAFREQVKGWLPRAIVCWRFAARAGNRDPAARLANMLCRRDLEGLRGAALAGYARLFDLAEAETWRARAGATQLFSRPSSTSAFRPDPVLAGAWLRLAEDMVEGLTSRKRHLDTIRAGLSVPKETADAWRIVRTRKPQLR